MIIIAAAKKIHPTAHPLGSRAAEAAAGPPTSDMLCSFSCVRTSKPVAARATSHGWDETGAQRTYQAAAVTTVSAVSGTAA
jgi:hypothetical protein